MSGYLFESPLFIGFVGGILSMVAAIVWLQTTRRIAGYSAACLSCLTVVLVLTNLNVVTDRERIESLLYRVADALGKNDFEAVYSVIHPAASETVYRAKSELPNYKFTEARVTGIKQISVDGRTGSESAIAEFNAFVDVATRGYSGPVRRFVRLYLLKRDGRWLVQNYEHFEPTAGFKQQLPAPSPNGSSPLEVWKNNR